MTKKVAIVLISFNSKQFLEECINSLIKQDYLNTTLIVVDNASPDDSNEFIENNYSGIILLKESVNHGFGVACNIGAKYALDHGADYVLFINTDTIADSNLVSELVKYADSSTVTTCFTYNDKNNLNPWYSGGRLNRINLYSEQTLYPYNPLHEPIEVSFISGCCMMIHKDVFSKVGFFDSDYFMYYEDAEYCARMIQNGIKLLYIQSTKLFHYEGGSQQKAANNSRLALYYWTRNRLFLACQHQELLDIPVHEFIKNSLLEQNYFERHNKWFVSYEKKGIDDFFKSKYGELPSFNEEYSEDFSIVERNEKFDFCHCMEAESYLKLCNYSDSRKSVHLRFNLLPAPTLDHGELDIFLNNKYLGLFNLPCSFDDIIEFSAQEVKYLKFKSRMKPISLPNDLRTFTFTIANILHTESSSIEIIKSSYIFGEESDLSDHWNWVIGKESEIKLYNFTGDNAVCRIKFSLLPAPTRESGTVYIYINGELYRKDLHIPGRIDDVIEIKPNENIRISFIYKDELIHLDGDSRSFAFQLRNFEYTQIDSSLSILRNIPFATESNFSVYGTGLNAMRFCERKGMDNCICFFDGKKEEGEFAEKPILKFCDETLRNYNIKQIVIAASEKYIKEIYERISPVCKRNGINVYDVYDIDLDYKYTIEICIQN